MPTDARSDTPSDAPSDAEAAPDTDAAPARLRLALDDARVRPDRREAFETLVRLLFMRRHLAYTAPPERMWLQADLVQTLRRQSDVYRALSTPMRGPLPFALGFLRLTPGGRVEPTADALPGATDPLVLARLLSSYLEPGAVLRFERLPAAPAAEGDASVDGKVTAWRVEGDDDLTPVDAEPP